MTPRRNSRFFVSLQQLERRLESESGSKKLCMGKPSENYGHNLGSGNINYKGMPGVECAAAEAASGVVTGGNPSNYISTKLFPHNVQEDSAVQLSSSQSIPTQGLGANGCHSDKKGSSLDCASEITGSMTQVVFSASWNARELQRTSDATESEPPTEFLATPSSSMVGLCCERSEKKFHDATDDKRHVDVFHLLYDQLGLSDNEISSSHMQMQEKFSMFDKHCVEAFVTQHKVGEGSNPHCNKIIDGWIEKLSQSHMEPYCIATLLIAKAALQGKQSPQEGQLSLQFPHVVDEWLTRQGEPC